MSRALKVHEAGPAITVQDRGRPGFLSEGLSRGGAMDVLALAEGAALLGQDGDLAALEMAGFGGTFEALEDMRIALTGAPFHAEIDGRRLVWNASHLLRAGARLSISGALRGTYGYLHVAGGVDTPPVLGSRAAHLAAGLGATIGKGDLLAVGQDAGGPAGLAIDTDERFAGGTVRVVPGIQSGLFAEEQRVRFEQTIFCRDPRANRMGIRLTCPAEGFHAEGGLNVLSETIVPGDVQVTGDGTPFVLMAECQTTGGYPRICTIIPPDLPIVAQAPAGAELRFRFVAQDEALDAYHGFVRHISQLDRRCRPLVRDPHDIQDLLRYQLVSGAISATDYND